MNLPNLVTKDVHFAVFLTRKVAVIHTRNRAIFTIPDLETREVCWLWAPEYSWWWCDISQRCSNSCVISSFNLGKKPPGWGWCLSYRSYCLEVSICINCWLRAGCILFLGLHLPFEALPPSEVVLCYTVGFQLQYFSFFLYNWISVSWYVCCACNNFSGLRPQINLFLGMCLKFNEKCSCIFTFQIVIIDWLRKLVFQSVPRVRLPCSNWS